MAIWQMDLMLVPKRRLSELFASVPNCINERLLETTQWWGNQVLRREDEELLNSMLPSRSSWNKKTLSWGEEDGNRIDIYLDSQRIREIFVRVDAREMDQEFLENIIRLANHFDCVVVTDQLEILPPLLDELTAAVCSSSARKFVENPKRYLDSQTDSPGE